MKTFMSKLATTLALLPIVAGAEDLVVPTPSGAVLILPGFRTYTAGGYEVSIRNVAAITAAKERLIQIQIPSFALPEPGDTSLLCRGSYPVYSPKRVPFEVLFDEAVRAEYGEAQVVPDREAPRVVVSLHAFNFSTFGAGKWTIAGSIAVGNASPFQLTSEYAFETSFMAAASCAAASEAMIPAIQSFLGALYADPRYSRGS